MIFNMRKEHLLAIGAMASGAAAYSTPYLNGLEYIGTPSPNSTCNFLKQNYPNMTLLPTDEGYAAENEGGLIH